MKHEKLAQALDAVSDRHLAEAARFDKRRRLAPWLGSLAAALALVILFTALSAPHAVTGRIAGPEYPKMAPYPGGVYSERKYNAWRDSRRLQYNQPQGYADNLAGFWARSIPELLSAGEGKNPVCSPLNVYMALAMLSEITEGETRAQILTLLGSDSQDALRIQAGQVWNACYSNDGATTTILGSSLWLDEGFSYRQQAADTLAERYYASVFRGDLSSREMNEALSAWLDEETGGLFKDHTEKAELPRETLLALFTTIYFRAKWASEFNPGKNTLAPFHSDSGDSTAEYMHQELCPGSYYWGADFGAVPLGLENSGQMWLILPDEGKTPQDVLDHGEALALVLGGGETENHKALRIRLSLPKFDIGEDFSLNSALQTLGITDAFDPAVSDYSPLTEEALYLDTVNHAARVAIDEEGITAAAYTEMLLCGSGAPPEEIIDFTLNRPFLFVITGRDSLPLFVGIVNQI